jgi:hypothetical protein
MKHLALHFRIVVYAYFANVVIQLSSSIFLPNDNLYFISQLLPPSFVDLYGKVWAPVSLLVYLCAIFIGGFLVLKNRKLGKFIFLGCFIYSGIMTSLSAPFIHSAFNTFEVYIQGGLELLLLYFMFVSEYKKTFK